MKPDDVQTHYPAMMAGYFNDLAQAQAALAEIEGLDLGELDPSFEKANLFVRRIEDEETAEAFFDRIEREFAAHHEGDQVGQDNAVVAARGDVQRLENLVTPIFQRHGAYQIKRYGAWPDMMASRNGVEIHSNNPTPQRPLPTT